MAQFSSKRRPRRIYERRADYLTDQLDATVEPARLCNLLEKVNAPLGPGAERGFPWITTVLGSGCLDPIADPAGPHITDVPRQIGRHLRALPPLPDGTDPARLARDFARSLITDRLGIDDFGDDDGDDDDGDAISVRTAHLVLGAALLTRFFHLASATSPLALSRPGHDEVSFLPHTAGAAEIESDVLTPLLDRLKHVLGALDADAASAAGANHGDVMLRNTLKDIAESLAPNVGPPRLKLARVSLVTELCWYFVSRGTMIYPGWSDLLLYLSIRHASSQTAQWFRRPAFDDMDVACQLVRERYEVPTRRSWELAATESLGGTGLYREVAAILREQVARRAAYPPAGPKAPPIASAFVTSFDLELEMALWRGSTEPFVVAVPMNLVQDLGSEAVRQASTCWLGCVIRPDHEASPDEQLDRLRNPRDEDWFLLSAETMYGRRYGTMPVVARLSGSPLMGRPSLVANEQWTTLCAQLAHHLAVEMPTGSPDPHEPALALAHAALLDEYSAMQQSAAEFFLYAPSGESNEILRYGLPADVTSVMGRAFARFWMMLGVQVADSGIRYRFASQMVAPNGIAGSKASDKQALSAGVVINWRIDEAVEDLLHWYNFDVVTDRCAAFEGELAHYLDHLRHPEYQAPVTAPCELP